MVAKRFKKLFYFALFFTVISLVLVSCGEKPKQKPQSQPKENSNVSVNIPAYLTDSYKALVKEGIKVTYNPIVTKPIPEPKKPYYVKPREIPKEWIVGELKWESADISFYGNYVLECVPKAGYKPLPSTNANWRKTILKLYKRKNVKEKWPYYLSKSDYSLIKVLDGEADNEPYPQNQGQRLSDKFVVWQSSSDAETNKWKIWGYDISRDKVFMICSYKDFKTSKDAYPTYKIRGNLLLISLVTEDAEGKLGRTVIVYDLKDQKTLKTFGNEQYIYMFPTAVGNYIYLNKSVRYDPANNSVPPTSVVRIDMKSGKEDIVIPNSRLFVASSFGDKVCLVSIDPNYKYNDVWVLDTSEKELTCYMKIPINDTDTKPGISLMRTGILYAGGQPDETPYYFYSFSKGKAFYTGMPLTPPDSQGRFLIMKYPLNMFYPIPPFNYEGKAERLSGHITYLIVKPN